MVDQQGFTYIFSGNAFFELCLSTTSLPSIFVDSSYSRAGWAAAAQKQSVDSGSEVHLQVNILCSVLFQQTKIVFFQ